MAGLTVQKDLEPASGRNVAAVPRRHEAHMRPRLVHTERHHWPVPPYNKLGPPVTTVTSGTAGDVLKSANISSTHGQPWGLLLPGPMDPVSVPFAFDYRII